MKAAAGALAAATLLLLAAFPATAGGTKIIISDGGHFGRPSGFDRHRHAHVFPHKFYHAHTGLIVVPQTVYVPYRRWVPGYWTYQWIPQAQSSYVWLPGHYDPNGYWVEGHYVPQTVQNGYYQPFWVSGSWAP